MEQAIASTLIDYILIMTLLVIIDITLIGIALSAQLEDLKRTILNRGKNEDQKNT